MVFTELRPEPDLRPHCRLAVFEKLEQPNRASGLSISGPADIEHIVQALELDRAVDAQVRPGAFGKRS